MRILSIRLKNINSLRGDHEINFEASPLREAGLFGIVGATGSGKSTLLDCITLALYGKVPRLGTVTKSALDKGGVILTRHEREALSEVVYASRKGVFKAQWSVSKTRNNTFRDIEMKVFNAEDELLTEKMSNAVDVNTENIGLDYDQFMKSILLSQGEFAKFLQSDKNKRAELLEKITGTRIFRKIGQKTFKEYSRRRQALENKDDLITDIGRDILGEEDRNTLVTDIQQRTNELALLQGQWDTARRLLEKKSRLAALREKLETLEKQVAQGQQLLVAFSEKAGEQLRLYEQLFPFRDQFREHERLALQLAAADRQLDIINREIQWRETEKEALVKELCAWLGQTVAVDSYVTELRKFRDEIRDLQQRCENAQKVLTDTHKRISALFSAAAFQQEKDLFTPRASNAGLLASLSRKLEERTERFNEMVQLEGWDPNLLTSLRGQLTSRVADLGLLKGEVRSYLQQGQLVKQADGKLTELGAQLKEIRLDEEQQLLKLAEQDFEQARKQREEMLSAEKLDGLRSQLNEGDPCPLCGATHHPYVHDFAKALLNSADDFADKRRKLDAQQLRWKQLSLKQEALQAGIQREQMAREGAMQQQKMAGAQIEAFKQVLGLDKVQHEEKVNELIAEEQGRLQRLEQCLLIQQWLPQARQLHTEIGGYDEQYKYWDALQQSVMARYTGSDIEKDCRDREESMHAMMTGSLVAEERKAATKQQQDKERETWLGVQAALEQGLKPLGFDDVGEALKKLIPEQEHKILVKQEQELSRQLAERKAAWKELEEQWNQESAGNDALVTVEMQEAAVERLKEDIGRQQQLLEDKRTIIIGDDNRLQQMAMYQAERKQILEALRPWEMLNKLIGDATGNKFNNKAQELTLQHLLVLANQRMQLLHGRYRLLEPDGDDDLRVVDGYMGGEVRTVKSLSGGETFILSLALALGLSDLASRDVKIESLFIDEGFGSLDPETLEEAMSTLEQLQTESNKMVGIISHVESLKERIYTQIRLEKGNTGFSALTIFPEPTEIHASE